MVRIHILCLSFQDKIAGGGPGIANEGIYELPQDSSVKLPNISLCFQFQLFGYTQRTVLYLLN